jgi:Tol biopolymer transport system component
MLVLAVPATFAGAAAAGSRIAFSSTRAGVADGNAEIYVMRADGRDQTRLTHDAASDLASDVDPTWSPDAARLAWTRIPFTATHVSPGHIWVMNADGSGRAPLTTGPDNDTNASWSPDGTRVAFTRALALEPGNTDVFVVDADGTGEQRLTTDSAFDGYPTWSPDGRRIAFTSDRDGDPELYTMAADGTHQRRMTYSPGADTHPAWSPTSNAIAFISDRDGFAQVYVTRRAGHARRVTSGVEGPGMPGANWAPTWSPKAGYIAYTADTDSDFDIMRIKARDGRPLPLVSNPAPDFAPDWSGLAN